MFYAKTNAASRESKIELLMLVSHFMVISRLNILLWISWNVLMMMRRKKKGHFLYIGGGAVLITTGANFLDTKYEFYGFIDDLRDAIN